MIHMMDIGSVVIGGNTGEDCVNNVLARMDVEFFRNIYFESKSGDIAQIDFLVVTNKCLICIEVKSYTRCIVKGSEYNKSWTVCYLNKTKSLYNPILQNKIHIDVILDCIGYNNFPILNYVVFPNSCSLYIDGEFNNVKVIKMSELWYEMMKDIGNGRKIKESVMNNVINKIKEYDSRMVELSEKHCIKYFSSGGS